ncbi:MAG TPA: hypothetical protein DER09_09545 [Prolixibacteraceae bacterium]|nr:hypothetical protein [Prolixibacteraceae bacterium]
MKFLCDVHISYSLVSQLKKLGFDTIHVNELPDKWFSTGKFICLPERQNFHNRMVSDLRKNDKTNNCLKGRTIKYR